MLLAISIDNAEKSNEFIKKIAGDGKGDVKFPLLSDPTHETIDAYGLFDKRYIGSGDEGIPKPSIFVLNENRKVFWASVVTNYRVRPSFADIREAIDKLKKLPKPEK